MDPRVGALRSLVVVALWAVASAPPLVAQIAAGEITGIVKDQAGAAVRGAVITVTAIETNRRLVLSSSSEGVYTAPSLPPGTYRVDVDSSGFRPVRRKGIKLSVGERARIDFDLVIGEIREHVTVTGDASTLRVESPSLGSVVEHEPVVQLPLNG